MNEDDWIDLSLFYVQVPRRGDDPPFVEGRCEVLYGEGSRVGRGATYMRDETLGDGLRIMKVSNQLSVIAATLTGEFFDYRVGRWSRRFEFGFQRRPLVVGLPTANGHISSPMALRGRIQQFVRLDKRALLERIEPAPLWWTSRKGLISSEFRQCRENFVQNHSRKTPSVV